MLRVQKLLLNDDHTPEGSDFLAEAKYTESAMSMLAEHDMSEPAFVAAEFQLALEVAHKEDYPKHTLEEFVQTSVAQIIRRASIHVTGAALDAIDSKRQKADD